MKPKEVVNYIAFARTLDLPNADVPFCKPRMMRPSFLYCSTGSQTRSCTPWKNCTTECRGPTPPKMDGSWFLLMSSAHSFRAKLMTRSTPSRPWRCTILRNFNCEQLSWPSPISSPAIVPCKARATLKTCNIVGTGKGIAREPKGPFPPNF